MKRTTLITILIAAAHILCAGHALAAGERDFNTGLKAFADDLSLVQLMPPDPQALRAAPGAPSGGGQLKWEIIPREEEGDSKGASFYGLPGIKQRAPLSRQEFCREKNDFSYFQMLILSRENRLSFRNAGGILNGGVCWWHSLLTRRQIYLTVFRPDLPKPSKDQVREIYRHYLEMDRVVEIPGYANFYDFSLDWHEFLQRKLEKWQMHDALHFKWIDGLSGETSTTPQDLERKMGVLFYDITLNKRIVWQMLQMPGVTSHAWLVVNMKKRPDGYDLTIVDSNFSGTFTVHYQAGDDAVRIFDYPEFVPYTGNSHDFDSIRRAQEAYCS